MSMNRDRLKAVRAAKALSDPTRFELLQRIAAAGEINCRDLTTLFRVSQATVSHHLKILTDAGLVHTRREGQFHYFSLRPGAVAALAAALARAFPERGPAQAPRRRRQERTA